MFSGLTHSNVIPRRVTFYRTNKTKKSPIVYDVATCAERNRSKIYECISERHSRACVNAFREHVRPLSRPPSGVGPVVPLQEQIPRLVAAEDPTLVLDVGNPRDGDK